MSIRVRLRFPIRRRRLAATVASASALALTAAGIGVAVIVSGSADAQEQPSSRFAETTSYEPLVRGPLALSNRPKTVVVELAGDPVIVEAPEDATPLNRSQRQS